MFFAKMFASAIQLEALWRRGLEADQRRRRPRQIVDEVIAANPKQWSSTSPANRPGARDPCRAGNGRTAEGQANPAVVNTMLKEKLG